MKKILKIVGIVMVVLFITIVIVFWLMYGKFIKAANSVKKIEDDLYLIEFTGDYGFDDFIAKGGAKSDSDVADYLVSLLSLGFYKKTSTLKTGNFGCSTIYTQDRDGTYFFGRNYDWEKCQTMIVHTKPKNGYESISTCCLDFLGFGDAYKPDGSIMDKIKSIAAIYLPLDGMNSQGLVIADLVAGDNEVTHQQAKKANLTTTTAIRLLLDKAANVDEAVALLNEYNMNSSVDFAHHFSIADATGKSVVVEYVNNEMIVTETKIVTNHYLSEGEKQGIGSKQSHMRYDTLNAYTGPAGRYEVRDILKSVAQNNYRDTSNDYEKTMWSIVYCPKSGSADFYFSENYEYSYELTLSRDGSFIKNRVK